MAAGIALRNAARTAINQLGNTVTITPQIASTNSRGYTAWSNGTAVNVTAATSQNILPKIIRHEMGNVQAGDLNIYVKDINTIAINDKVTLNGVNYRIQQLKPIYIENILVVTVGVCFKDTPQ